MTATHELSEEASPEQELEFLLRRDKEQKGAIADLQHGLADLQEETGRQIDDLREELHGHVGSRISTAEGRYRPLRIIGAVALAVGLALAPAGNFA